MILGNAGFIDVSQTSIGYSDSQGAGRLGQSSFLVLRLAIRPEILAIMHRLTMKDDADRELSIFTEAIKVPIRERAAFLDTACHGDENLRGKVEALLNAHDRIGNFLEEPPGGDSIG